MLHQIKVPQFYNGLGLQIALNPPVNGKIQGLFKTFECFLQLLFKANLFFNDFSKTVLYIQVLFKPVGTLSHMHIVSLELYSLISLIQGPLSPEFII